ncbi:MAG: MlaD family protein [candidate division WOR-3 bacterium]|nr:MlaD family protein [candidate division WOR-3 bacterium]
MSKTLKEVLIGIFIIIGIVIFIFMTAWFRGKIGSGKEKDYKVYFDNVSGLRVGDPVEVLGLVKGRVKGMRLEDNRIMVIISLSQDVKLTKAAKFAIRSLSYIGGDKYLLVSPGIGEPATDKTLFYGENESLNLEQTFLKLDRLIDSLAPLKLGSELTKTKDELIAGLRNELKPVATSIPELTGILNRMAVKFDSLGNLLIKESTVKELFTSKELYDEILATNRQLQDLIKDIKANPQRYIQLRLFK